MPVHEVAASGFDREAAAYDRARPSYPAETVDWLCANLGISGWSRIADVAAGTGKLTTLLAPRCDGLLAVEPVAGMRTALRAALPRIDIVASTAEALPLQAGALDAITVAQAFHWFDATAALAEFARVLRPGGRLGLVWNARDRSAPLVDAIWSIMDRVERSAPWRNHEEWRESAFVDNPWFGHLHEATFQNVQELTPAGMVHRVRSVSHVAALPAEEQAVVLDEVRAVLGQHPDAAGKRTVQIPYRVDAYWCERA